MATSTSRQTFVLGTTTYGNRKMVIVEPGVEYDLDPAAIQYQTDETVFGDLAETE